MSIEMTVALHNESQMSEAVARHVANAAREIKVGDCGFDVVGYDKQLQLFKLVECKLGSQSTTIGKTFGQIAAYCAVLSTRGRDFVEAFNEKVHLPFSQLMEATNNAKRIQVAFYVALTHDACKQQIELIRAVKGLLPLVGIIRVRPDGKCRAFLRRRGQKDWDLAKATPTVIKISQNGN